MYTKVYFFLGHSAHTRGAEGSTPKASKSVVCGKGVSPSPLGLESGEGAVTLPRKFRNFTFETV